ncbi:MAG: DUF342 domain-containing protein [Ruminiclostridium sp.]|nr:DUF342 domain-containing protein [Ruminiclostridium sp.]
MSDPKTAGDNIYNGFFEITYKEDGVYLSVHPPVAKGKPVEAGDVIDKLAKKLISGFSRELLERTVRKADKVPVRIAEPQEEKKINATANLVVSPDKMKAYISINPPEGGRMIYTEEVQDVLNKNGIVYGINKVNIETIIKYPVYNEMFCVAEGVTPVNGQSGRVEFYFDIQRDGKPAIMDDGRVDFRELNLIESVRKGQKLCELIPPTPGVKGKTVFGTDIIPLDGKPAVMPKGRNVSVTEDGLAIVSNIDGQVRFIDGKINIFSTYEVPADVDNSTGNINFVGNVCVRGNVLSGFSIEAGGNVEVWGVVEGASIKAGGDIILRRGMQGMGKGVLISNGDIIARYIEYSNIEAKNNISSEAVMHSNVKCGKKLELAGRKGLLVGGSCKVGKEVVAKVIGSHMATVTDIEVGIDPSLRESYKALKEELNTLESDVKKAEQAITILKKLEIACALTPEKQEMLTKSVRTKVFFSNRIIEIKEEMQRIEVNLQKDAFGKIKCLSYIYPGTKVTIGTCIMYVRENLQYCTLYRDGADVKVGSIDK